MTRPEEIRRMFREDAEDHLDGADALLLALEEGNAPGDVVDVLFRHAHSIKGVAGMIGADDAYAIAHAIETVLERARRGGSADPSLAAPLLAASRALRAVVAEAGEVDADAVVAALASVGEGAAPPVAEPAPPAPEPAERASMRVEARRVDSLLDAVGEAIGQQERLRHVLAASGTGEDDDASEALQAADRVLAGLQEDVLELRMVPLTTITAPLVRAVRDLAVEQGKEAALDVTGEDTHLDRRVLEGMRETIVHLLRNAIAHGIEPPAEREAAGKSRIGRVELRAEPRGDRVALEVSDDGRGVASELLARTGTGRSLADVLTEPGLSTSTTVTAVAGRGVGLDAVRRHVESLRGTIEVASVAGRGTTITVLLPLTLALMRVLVLSRGGRRFGVPIADVEEALVVDDETRLGGVRSTMVRGALVPTVDVAAALGAEGSPPLGERSAAVLVRAGGERAVVLCDELHGDRDVLVKSLGPLLAALPAYFGGAIESDGGVTLIVDTGHLVRRARDAVSAVPAAPVARTRTLLVVDDQFTVRELQRSILEAAGYRVLTARNGVEAVRMLAAEPAVDLIVTDIEMPEMDGLALLGTVRRDPRLANLPVVVVTSRAGEDNERRGMEAGADAYIVKERFNQQALLGTVERLLGR